MTGRFRATFLVTVTLAAVYPLLCFLIVGSEGLRWLRNNPAYAFFVVIVEPCAVASFAVAFDLRIVRGLSVTKRRWMAAFLVAALGLVVINVIDDARQEPIPPLHVSQPLELLRLDTELRRDLPEQRTETTHQASESARRLYNERVRARVDTSSGVAVLRGSNILGWTAMVQNLLTTAFALVVFAYLIVLANVAQRATPEREAMVTVCLLLLLWFPMRLYSEWYENYYSLAYMQDYAAFVALAILAVVALMLLVYVVKPGAPLKVFAATHMAILVGAGVAAAFKPGAVGYLAEAFERLTLPTLIAVWVAMGAGLTAWVTALVGYQTRRSR